MDLAEASGLATVSVYGKQNHASDRPGDKYYDGWSNIKVGKQIVGKQIHNFKIQYKLGPFNQLSLVPAILTRS